MFSKKHLKALLHNSRALPSTAVLKLVQVGLVVHLVSIVFEGVVEDLLNGVFVCGC
jgi:hypothetical protein